MDYIYEMSMQCTLESTIADLSNMTFALETENDGTMKKSIIKRILDTIMKLIHHIMNSVSKIISNIKRKLNNDKNREVTNKGSDIARRIEKALRELINISNEIIFEFNTIIRVYRSNNDTANLIHDDSFYQDIEIRLEALMENFQKLKEDISNGKYEFDANAKVSVYETSMLNLHSLQNNCKDLMNKCHTLVNDVGKIENIDKEIVRRINKFSGMVSKLSAITTTYSTMINNL